MEKSRRKFLTVISAGLIGAAAGRNNYAQTPGIPAANDTWCASDDRYQPSGRSRDLAHNLKRSGKAGAIQYGG